MALHVELVLNEFHLPGTVRFLSSGETSANGKPITDSPERFLLSAFQPFNSERVVTVLHR